MELKREQIVFVRPVANIQIGLPLVILTVVSLAVGTSIETVKPELDRTDSFLNDVVSLIETVGPADLFGIEMPRGTGSRVPGDIVHRRGGLGTVEQAAATTDLLDLGHTLRHGKIVKRRKTDPVAGQRNAVHQNGDEFRFLRIAQTAIAEIELTGRVLLGDKEAGRLGEELLEIVVRDGRLLVELDHRGLFCDRDLCS